MERFCAVNVDIIRTLRNERGWSQKDLARIAGYSDRLIRKAEGGGSLSLSTIRHLAEALSTDEFVVSPETLMADILSIAKRFVEAYDLSGKDMLASIRPFLTDDFVFHVAGDPKSAPFVGDWVGPDGFQRFLDIFFGAVTRNPGSLTPTYTTNENSVIASYVDTLFVPEHPPTVLWTYLHFYFRDGFLARVEDRYDTHTAVQTKIEF